MFSGGNPMVDIDIGNGYTLGFDLVASSIIICAIIAVFLVLSILAVIVLFRQKAVLNKIYNKLAQLSPDAAYAQGYMPPPKNACPKCGAIFTPGSVFCQKCGSAL